MNTTHLLHDDTVKDERSLFLAWLGVLVLSFAWLRALYIYLPPSPDARLWFAAGVLLLVAGCRGRGPGPQRLPLPEGLLLAAASLAGVVFLPSPQDVGPALLLAAAALAVLPMPAMLRRQILPGLWTAGLVLVIQAALVPLLFVVASRLHTAPILTPLVAYPLKLLAPGTIRTGATLHLPTNVDATTLTPTWEKLGLIPGALLAAGGLTLLFLHRRGAARLGGFLVLGTLFAWLRLLFLFLIVNRFRNPQVFWSFEWLFLGFLPLPFLQAAWWRTGAGREASPSESAPPRPGRWLTAAGALLCVAGLTAFWGHHDAGTRQQGRVLIDEGHSDWEWTTHVFDTEWYGAKSGYNYYCLADYWNRFYRVETHRDPLTPRFLSQWDVVVLKTPTRAYAEEEIDAVADFVRRGGGLYLVGDHTNVFGSSTFLNPIAARFGMYFRYDATYTLQGLALSLYRRPRLLPHPVTRHVPDFLFATSNSLDTPLLSENVILGYGLRSMYLDYSETSYFPTKPDKMDYLFPLLVQAGGVRYGKGRVLGFTDSTVFSNFFMFIPGKPELALASIEWLNRRNGSAIWHWAFLVAGLAGAAILVWEMRRWPRIAYYDTLVAVGLVAFVLVARWCEHEAARAYPLPQPVRPLQEVVFDGEHGGFQLPVAGLLADHWSNLHTFYVWTQRLGLVPRLASRLQGALDAPGRVLVQANPRTEFTLEEIDGIVDFVRRGGTLLVMDTPENATGVANRILGPFQLAFDAPRSDSVAVVRPAEAEWLPAIAAGDTLAVVQGVFGVRGGHTLLALPDGTPVMAWRSFGAGKVVAFGASKLFGNTAMGNTAAVPDERQRRLYDLEYALFGDIAGIHVGDRYATSGAADP